MTSRVLNDAAQGKSQRESSLIIFSDSSVGSGAVELEQSELARQTESSERVGKG